MRSKIYISYRRATGTPMATLLRQRIATRLGEERVFHDVVGINPGENFPEMLRSELAKARFTLALVEQDWLTTSDHLGRRRIDLETDWVRRELAYSLAEPDVTVIPILIGSEAGLPSANEESALPADLQPLLTLQRMRINYDSLEHDVAPIIQQLANHFAPSDPEPEPTAQPEPELEPLAVAPPKTLPQPESVDRVVSFFDSKLNLFGMAGIALALLAGLIWPIGAGRLVVTALLAYAGGALLAYVLFPEQSTEP